MSFFRRVLSLLPVLLCVLASTAVYSGEWSAEAWTPRVIHLTGSYLKEERKNFEDNRPTFAILTGWKRDASIKEVAAKAVSHRLDKCRMFKATKRIRTSSGFAMTLKGFWIEPDGQMHFPAGAKRETYVPQAEVLFHLWLEAETPLTDGQSFNLILPTGEMVPFVFKADAPTPLIKVNQVAYSACATEKYAYIGGWMGTGGSCPYEATDFQVVSNDGGKVVLEGKVSPRVDDPVDEEQGICWTGEVVSEIDLSSLETPGEYYVRVPGVGRSDDFRISEHAALEAFQAHLGGLKAKRCGVKCHKKVVRGCFPPDQGDYDNENPDRTFGFFDAAGKPVAVSHFRLIQQTAPKNPVYLEVQGGWHDAADYDRRPFHEAIAGNLALLALLEPEFSKAHPELLEEAKWGLKHLQAVQEADGSVGTWFETICHPTSEEGGPLDDPFTYYISRATRNSTMEYAAYASCVALASGDEALKESAARAWKFAIDPENARVTKYIYNDQPITFVEDPELPVQYLIKASFNLYLLYRDDCYLEALEGAFDKYKREIGNDWKWSPLIFLEMEIFEGEVPSSLNEIHKIWRDKLKRQAVMIVDDQEKAFPYRTPWISPSRAWATSMGWGNSHPLRRALYLIAARAADGWLQYLDAAFLANDFHNGVNPLGMTMTTGLGKRWPHKFLDLESMAQGHDVPGISPYLWIYNIEYRDREFVHYEEIFPELDKTWPIWHRWANIAAWTVPSSEFSVWETIGPAAIATGYLAAEEDRWLQWKRDLGK